MTSNQVETHIQLKLSDRNRGSVFFRLFLAIPAAIYLATFTSMAHFGWSAAGVFVLPVVLTLLFTGKYPSYVLTFNHAIFEFATRLSAYALMLTDEYPTIEANPNIAVLFPDVEGGAKLSRGLPLVKWLFAIPLMIVGFIYSLIALPVALFSWVITAATGSMPSGGANYLLKVLQFWNRVFGYCALLVTDDYPSFTL